MAEISVIMPVYKVEKYLRKCINSVLEQTFQDFEFIIVDDGSPDACGAIADEYERKYEKVRVIHKENGGAPSARNAGMEIATGKYYYFPDSDDWLEPDYLMDLYNLAQSSGAQMIISGYKMEYYDRNFRQVYDVSVPEEIYGTQERVRHNLHKYFDNMMMAVPWNKLYRAEYIKENHLEFPDLKWDDLHFNMEVIMDIESVAISSSSGYHFFRSRQGSETTYVFDHLLYQKRREQFEHILKVYRHWKIHDKEIQSVIYGYYAARLVQCVEEIAVSQNTEKRKMISDILHDDLNQRALNRGKINSKLLSIAAIPMKMQWTQGCIWIGKGIGGVKKNMPTLYNTLKSKSVNKGQEV